MFKNESYQLMGVAFEVYNQLGYGMAEEVYQQSLGLPEARVEFHVTSNALIQSLSRHRDDVDLLALDHDLEMIDPGEGKLVDPGTGLDAAEWLAQISP